MGIFGSFDHVFFVKREIIIFETRSRGMFNVGWRIINIINYGRISATISGTIVIIYIATAVIVIVV